MTLATQQTHGPNGEALAAGMTLEAKLVLHPKLPDANQEYSVRKFDPAGGNALLEVLSRTTFTPC